ncbi:hypothetical protein GCM10007920_37200 [Ciceribacter naphthalenivorans]|uniref:Uncharacterized protein n=1 Tax=Sphingomonas psychrolutea TaxID=1259676 RepID=A0ABQ6EGB3_9SPHN|nr:hypothetical protein GCM10007920_37200 [Ciceribacter naphthalenivorans]GLT06782.1 hypothetical protein GCM10007926_37200 [Sphingomonas psychrolutea]
MKVVTFGIDNAELLAFVRHTLRQQGHEAGFAASGIACNQHQIALVDINVQTLPVDAYQNTASRKRQNPVILEQDPVDQFGNAFTMVLLQLDIDFQFEGRDGIGDGCGASASCKKCMIVLRVTHGDDVQPRNIQVLESMEQS